jgi:pyruvate,water dikinase
MERIRDINPSYHLSLLYRRYEALAEDERAQMQTTSFRNLAKLSGLKDLRDEIEGFLDDFGHLSDSGNDFSTATWREAPEMVLEMIAGFKKPRVEGGQRIDVSALSKNPLRRLLLRFLYGRAAKYREYRERISFLYTYGYGLFRPYFLHLAGLFVENGFLKQRQDLFYLTLAEIQRVVKLGKMPSELENAVEERKKEVVEYKDIVLPDLIYGDSPPRPLASTPSASKLKGLGVSKGYYEGGTKVVRGIRDFHKIEEGDILVIPFSDVSWTPLFAKAKAVISESGGMLSHSAIVAREYNIPAVVSVQGALELEDGTVVRVDGSSGEITVLGARGDESKPTKAVRTH